MERRRLNKLVLLWRKEGMLALARAVGKSIDCRLRGRKNLLVFERKLDQPVSILPTTAAITMRPLKPEDMGQIRSVYFPFMTGDLENDKEYFILWEHAPISNCRCFVAELDGEIVHYSWVTTSVKRVGVIKVGIDGAYIGPCFTLPRTRGLGIYPHALTFLIRQLQLEGFRRVVIQARRENPPSIKGIERAGFLRLVED